MKIPKIGWALFAFFWSLPLLPATNSDLALQTQATLIHQGKQSLSSLLAAYREGIREDRKNPRNYLLAAALYDREESQALYEKAISLSPKDVAARVAFGRYLLYREKPQAALAQYQQALTLAPQENAIRISAIRAAVQSTNLEEALRLAGDDPTMRAEFVQILVDENKLEDARKYSAALGVEAGDLPAALAARGRLLFSLGQKNGSDDQQQKGLDLILEGWRKSPANTWFYKYTYPRRSLVQLLTDAHRPSDARALLEKAHDLYPRDYTLYESYWKLKFTAVKTDYSPEREAVKKDVDALLKNYPADPDLYRAAALGYTMADAKPEADRINERLLQEFPYSQPAMWVRRTQIVRCKDLRQKLALIERMNADFPNMSMYSDWFKTLVELKPTNEELLKGAKEYLQKYPYTYLALNDIGDAFLERRIYLDRLLSWMDEEGIVSKKNPNAWDVRNLAVRGQVLLLQGRLKEAETTLRPLLDVKTQGLSNVDLAKVRYGLGGVLEKRGRMDEAVDMYAQAFAESQHYNTEAGERFRSLYQKVFHGEKGMDDYLGIREGMYQIATDAGIERGTKIEKPAPEFDLQSLQGARVNLSSLKGKVVILNFWATWCGPCIAELPHFQEFYNEMKDDPGVAVLAVTTDENRALVAPFIREHQYTFPVLFDEGVRKQFGVRGIPATFIIDPSGMIQLRMIGFNQNEPLVPYLKKLVAQFSAVKPGSTAPPPEPPTGLQYDYSVIHRILEETTHVRQERSEPATQSVWMMDDGTVGFLESFKNVFGAIYGKPDMKPTPLVEREGRPTNVLVLKRPAAWPQPSILIYYVEKPVYYLQEIATLPQTILELTGKFLQQGGRLPVVVAFDYPGITGQIVLDDFSPAEFPLSYVSRKRFPGWSPVRCRGTIRFKIHERRNPVVEAEPDPGSFEVIYEKKHGALLSLKTVLHFQKTMGTSVTETRDVALNSVERIENPAALQQGMERFDRFTKHWQNGRLTEAMEISAANSGLTPFDKVIGERIARLRQDASLMGQVSPNENISPENESEMNQDFCGEET